MKTSFISSIWLSPITFLLLYVLILNNIFPSLVLVNGCSLEINLAGLLSLVFLFYFFRSWIHERKPILVFLLTLISVILVCNFSMSFLIDLVERSRNYEYETNDMSAIVIIPLVLLIAIIWGAIADRLKNKQASSQE